MLILPWSSLFSLFCDCKTRAFSPPTHPPPHRPDSPLVYPILWDTPDTQSDD